MNYRKIYSNIIENALIRNIDNNIIYEQHHIVPKSLGGLDDAENLVFLTLREHFIAHLLLIKCFDNKELIYGYNAMFIDCSKNYSRYRSKLFKIKKINGDNSDKLFPRPIKNVKNCETCGKETKKKYCCSKECYLTFLKTDNSASKNMSDSATKHLLSLSKVEMVERMKNSAGKCDHIERGKSISRGKKGKKLGPNARNAIHIQIFDNNDILICESIGGFQKMCMDNGLPISLFRKSYMKDQKIIVKQKNSLAEKYEGWRAIKC